MPEAVRNDLRVAPTKLTVAAPSGRNILFGDGSDCDWGDTRISRYGIVRPIAPAIMPSLSDLSPRSAFWRIAVLFCLKTSEK